MTAVLLRETRVQVVGTTAAGPPRLAIAPGVFALARPVRPRGWWKQRAFAAHQRARARLLQASGLFDAAWYHARYPDIAAAGMEPLQHFLEHGSFEGRSPGPGFDALGYLARYPDVVTGKIEPWLHYVLHGKPEGRNL